MRKCELCESLAKMYCESDQASLCWDCDAKVHGANFLVAKHSRTLLCHVCQALTPWTGSGSKLGPTVSVCENCVVNSSSTNSREEEDEGGNQDDDDQDGDSDSDYDSDREGDDSDDDDNGGGGGAAADDEDNQVVPWSPSSSSSSSAQPPPISSSSNSEECSSTRFCNGEGGASDQSRMMFSLKRTRETPDSDSHDQMGSSMLRTSQRKDKKRTAIIESPKDKNPEDHKKSSSLIFDHHIFAE